MWFFNNCDGIELQLSSNNLIENCAIFNNTHTGIDAIVSSNNYNIIKNCDIYNNNVNGIYISSSSSNEIISCSFWGNNDGDIIITEDSSDNLLIDLEQKAILLKNENRNLNKNLEDNQQNNIYEINKDNEVNNKKFNNLIEMILNIIPILKTMLTR